MTRKTIHDYVAVLGIAFCVAALAACSSEEQAGGLPEADASLGISLGTAAGSLTKADADAEVPDGGYDGDKYARAHEFINSLWVYVVDAGGTVQAGWTLADGESWGIDNEVVQAGTAPEGNIIRWTGPVTDLPAGRYTLYAFANLENYVSDKVKHSFTGQKTMLTENDLSKIMLEKPAEKVDFADTTKMYIPMSGKKEITLTRKNQTERIELVRLLSRVDVTVTNEKNEEVAFNSFTMGKFADKVGLMDMLNGTQTTFNWEYKKTFDPSWEVAAGETHSFSFYVPETAQNNSNQYVDMQTTDNKTYYGLLTTSGIPRNHVLPLNLILHDDSYALTVYAYIAPIGGYPVQVEVGSPSLTEGYTLTLPEGCSFRIVATKTTDGSTSAEDECTLNVTDQTNGVIAVDGESWGHVTALPGQTGAVVVGMPGGSQISYTVNITTEPLKDWVETYNLYNTRKP